MFPRGSCVFSSAICIYELTVWFLCMCLSDRSMTEEICEQLLGSVAGELDHYIHDYSEKFLDKI